MDDIFDYYIENGKIVSASFGNHPEKNGETDVNQLFDYTIFDETVIIDNYKGADRVVSIPSHIEGYPVTRIGKFAFSSLSDRDTFKYTTNHRVTSVTIPNGVKIIAESAFDKCPQLRFIYLPSSLREIRENAFRGCNELCDFHMPKTVEIIGPGAFSECKDLTHVTIPGYVETLSSNAFADCISLKELTVEEGVNRIGSSAFSRCANLKTVHLPESLEIIKNSAFEYCTRLEHINMPKSLKTLENDIFYRCDKLIDENSMVIIEDSLYYYCGEKTEITIPEQVTVIAPSAFSGCFHITDVTLHQGVTEIGYRAFLRCTELKSINFPDSLQHIGFYAFFNCISLKDIKVPLHTKIDDMAFYGCESLTNRDGLVIVNNQCHDYIGDLKTITLPEGIDTLCSCVFSQSRHLQEVILPETIRFIGYKCFSECTRLRKINIPDGVQVIGNGCFAFCVSLKELIIPDSVIFLGDNIMSYYDISTCVKCNELHWDRLWASVRNDYMINNFDFICCYLLYKNVPDITGAELKEYIDDHTLKIAEHIIKYDNVEAMDGLLKVVCADRELIQKIIDISFGHIDITAFLLDRSRKAAEQDFEEL